jgi:hypothetical protein
VTDARLQQVHADILTAREFVEHATRFLSDARIDGLGAASRAILLHNAATAACDGILQASGLRVTPGDRSHALRLEEALQRLEGDTEDLLERLDVARVRRNEASYAAGFIAQASLRDADEATTELVDRARGFVGTDPSPRE